MRPIHGGIDFGTSNSTVGVIENGRPRLVPLEGGEVTLPSAVFFNYEDNGVYLGREAIGLYTDAVEGRLIGINPYGQPGVEAYKKNMGEILYGKS